MSIRKIALHLEEADGRTIRINIGAAYIENDRLSVAELLDVAKQVITAAARLSNDA